MEDSIPIHPLTEDPTKAWSSLSQTQKVVPLKMKNPKSPILPDKVRFVCMADTHSLTKYLPFRVPDGDVFIHAGDFTRIGELSEVQQFNAFLGTLPHKHKVVIAGNHELSFDESTSKNNRNSRNLLNPADNPRSMLLQSMQDDKSKPQDLITNATYLEDESTTVLGIKIYGSPWQPAFCDWAFNLPRGQPCLDKWNLIPTDVDVLITHGPPIGHGDLCISGLRAGCVELLTTVQQRVKPKFHVFGHIHEGYGTTTDGNTVFINASTCTIGYKPTNTPIIFDMPLPDGVTKE